jgi:hypothetical protein
MVGLHQMTTRRGARSARQRVMRRTRNSRQSTRHVVFNLCLAPVPRCASHLLPKSITKIREIHSTPSPRTNITTNKSQRKKEISYENLPQGTKNYFKTQVIPLALDTTGVLKPWTTPCDETIIEIWNLVFGRDHLIDEGDTGCYLFIIAKTLVSACLYFLTCACRSSWRHRHWLCASAAPANVNLSVQVVD